MALASSSIKPVNKLVSVPHSKITNAQPVVFVDIFSKEMI